MKNQIWMINKSFTDVFELITEIEKQFNEMQKGTFQLKISNLSTQIATFYILKGSRTIAEGLKGLVEDGNFKSLEGIELVAEAINNPSTMESPIVQFQAWLKTQKCVLKALKIEVLESTSKRQLEHPFVFDNTVPFSLPIKYELLPLSTGVVVSENEALPDDVQKFLLAQPKSKKRVKGKFIPNTLTYRVDTMQDVFFLDHCIISANTQLSYTLEPESWVVLTFELDEI